MLAHVGHVERFGHKRPVYVPEFGLRQEPGFLVESERAPGIEWRDRENAVGLVGDTEGRQRAVRGEISGSVATIAREPA